MNDPLRTPEDYELFLYTIAELFSSVRRSTLTFVRRGTSLARVAGELYFDHDIRVIVRERLVYSRLPAVIDWYGYEVWRGAEKLFSYDPQPHASDISLQSTHPHHKHIPPGIKHNRIPAPNISFTRPNRPEIIQEVDALIVEINK